MPIHGRLPVAGLRGGRTMSGHPPMALHDFAVTSGCVQPPEALALSGRQTIPVVDKVAQIDPRLAGSDGPCQQVAPAWFESDPAGCSMGRRENPAVRKSHATGFRHLELLLDPDFVGSGPFLVMVVLVAHGMVVEHPLHVGKDHFGIRNGG